MIKVGQLLRPQDVEIKPFNNGSFIEAVTEDGFKALVQWTKDKRLKVFFILSIPNEKNNTHTNIQMP